MTLISDKDLQAPIAQRRTTGVLWFSYSLDDCAVIQLWELAGFRTEIEAAAFQRGVNLSPENIAFQWPAQRDDVIDWISDFVDSDGRPVTIADVEAAIQAQCGPDTTG